MLCNNKMPCNILTGSVFVKSCFLVSYVEVFAVVCSVLLFLRKCMVKIKANEMKRELRKVC